MAGIFAVDNQRQAFYLKPEPAFPLKKRPRPARPLPVDQRPAA